MMTSNRPYLIRALYEWIVDNGLTPHLLVNAQHPQAMVPQRFVSDGRIVLNVAPSAVQGLLLHNEMIQFSARFGGVATAVSLPPAAVLGIYARENQQGMLFPPEEIDDDAAVTPATTDTNSTPPDADKQKRSEKPDRPTLRIVK